MVFRLDDIGNDLAEAFFVEFQRFGDVIEDAQVIHDQAVGLFVAVGAVGARDGLQQGVVAHRFVEVHGLQDGRVEAGQQLGGDDQDLQRVVRVAEAVEQLFFGYRGRACRAGSARPPVLCQRRR